MKLFNIIFVFTVFISSIAFAESYTLRNEETGKTYYCSESSDGSPNLSSCMREISAVCKKAKGAYSDSICFSESKSLCKTASAGFPRCVSDIFELCKQAKGSYSEPICYSEALETCK